MNRQDACNAIGNWPGCPNVGYDYWLNTTQFANGSHTLTVTTTTAAGRVASASVQFTVTYNPGGTASTGCPSGLPCLDDVPATYLCGSWIEDNSSSEWTLTANNGLPGGTGNVSGSVLVFPRVTLRAVLRSRIRHRAPTTHQQLHRTQVDIQTLHGRRRDRIPVRRVAATLQSLP